MANAVEVASMTGLILPCTDTPAPAEITVEELGDTHVVLTCESPTKAMGKGWELICLTQTPQSEKGCFLRNLTPATKVNVSFFPLPVIQTQNSTGLYFPLTK